VLSRGLLGGNWPTGNAQKGDIRSGIPRFQGENLDNNLLLIDALRAVAEEKGVTVAELSIAWVLARGDDIVPLIGARRRDQLSEALGALNISLSEDDLERIERAVPPNAVAGERYPVAQMAHLDSERIVSN
jgi:aryl-alcohol dehydrogenase-like predicted oxidoreductase